MLKGRPAKSAGLKKAEGNVGHRKVKPEAAGVAGAPEAPGWLDGAARDLWGAVAPLLEKIGLDHLDRESLGVWCQAAADVARLTLEVRGEGEVLVTEKGYHYHNPKVALLEKARDRVVRLGAEFGMSPSSRARFASAESAPKDAFELWAREQGL